MVVVRGVVFYIILLLGVSGWAAVTPHAQLSALDFVSPDYENTHDHTFVFAGVSLVTPGLDNTFNVDLQGAYAMGKPVLNFINIREIYMIQRFIDFSISYGRKKHLWSGLDEAWHLGFFQPQFRWNSIDPQAQGQTGVFFESAPGAQFSWSLFGSPIFVPDQGPGFELKEGQFQSTNPWFSSPPQKIEFGGEIFPIDYNVTMPKNEDVILQASYGAQAGWQSDSGYYVRGAYLSTPSHQIAINYKAVLVADRVRVDFTPKTYREQNFSLDVGYRQKSWNISLFFLSNQPEEVTYETNFNSAILPTSSSWGPQFHWQGEILGVYGNGIFTQNHEVRERGPDASQISTPLTTKYLYKSATQLGLTVKKGRLYQGAMEWTESPQDSLKFLKLKNRFHATQTWSFFLDFLLVDTSGVASPVSHLQNLDQAWGGVDYEF